MRSIGVDIGSTYTKYCIRDLETEELLLSEERTPIRQKEYFDEIFQKLESECSEARIVSCGYGRHNISSEKNVNELTALAKGAEYVNPGIPVILDIGGQDTKIITQDGGKLKEFFINDKCAAGCGMFLVNTLNLLQTDFSDIDLAGAEKPENTLSSTCAVFAQTEIVGLLAQNIVPEEIIRRVLWQILIQSSALLTKVECDELLLTGGLTQIKGIADYATLALKKRVIIPENAMYLSAIGASLL